MEGVGGGASRSEIGSGGGPGARTSTAEWKLSIEEVQGVPSLTSPSFVFEYQPIIPILPSDLVDRPTGAQRLSALESQAEWLYYRNDPVKYGLQENALFPSTKRKMHRELENQSQYYLWRFRSQRTTSQMHYICTLLIQKPLERA